MIKRFRIYFSPHELTLLAASLTAVLAAFLIFGGKSRLTLLASMIGVVFLMLNAKANPAGQLLTIVFSVLYGYISYSFGYYGEMITYLGMTAPMALFSLISWLRHPFGGRRSEVEVNAVSPAETVFAAILTAAVTALFYFILKALGTANIILSTVSVTTSFAAVYLTFRRSPYFALAYAMNDLVLVALWALASAEDRSYVSVTVCFAVFFINDLYGFISWRRIRARQEKEREGMG